MTLHGRNFRMSPQSYTFHSCPLANLMSDSKDYRETFLQSLLCQLKKHEIKALRSHLSLEWDTCKNAEISQGRSNVHLLPVLWVLVCVLHSAPNKAGSLLSPQQVLAMLNA